MKRTPIDAALMKALRTLQGNMPLYLFARRLGLSMQTIAMALAGANVQAGTRALLLMKVNELAQGNNAVGQAGAAA